MEKINELIKEKQEYIKEKQIIEQEINKKEQELTNNKIEINDLKLQNKLLKEGLDNLKKSNDLKNKENNKLKTEIKGLKKVKIDKDLRTKPKMIHDVRKRDDKARTFAPPDNTIKWTEDEETKIYKHLARLKLPSDRKSIGLSFDTIKRPEDLERDEIFKDMNKYEDINLDDVNKLINTINDEITEGDNIVDIGNNREIYFRDLINFLYDIKGGKINDFNKEREYEKRLKNIEYKIANKKRFSRNIRFYEQYINRFKRILFGDKKLSGRGLTISSLPILLSKMYANNSSKELINNIKQLVNNLYDNKQITKQLYNIRNKALRQSLVL